MVAVSATEKLSVMRSDGIVGLSPKDVNGNRNSFIESLYTTGLISERVFSLSLKSFDDYSQSSYLVLGGYDTQKFAQNSPVTWNSLISNDYWTVRLS